MVSKNKVSGALMSVLSFPCNSGCVFLRALSVVCQKSDRAMNKCPLLPSHKNTWQKGGSLSCLMSLNFKRYETCLNQEKDKKELPSLKTG